MDLAEDQPDFSGSAMIALYPPPELAATLALPDGLDVDDLHITVAYVGDAADVDPEALKDAARALSAREPVAAVISGHARFTGGDQDVIVALADSPQLDDLRRDALAELAGREIGVPSGHGYTAHMSLAYVGQDESDPVGRLPSEPVLLGAISAVHGNDRTDYPLSPAAGFEAAARAAFAEGFALTDGPITPRIEAACIAAVRSAAEHAGSPSVLEVARSVGITEGTRSGITQRRDRLYAEQAALIGAAWNTVIAALDIAAMVRAFRRLALLVTASGAMDLTAQQKAELRAQGQQAAAGTLYGAYRADGHDALIDAILAGLAAAFTLGSAAALAAAAARAGRTGFGWAAALAALRKDPEPAELPSQADQLLRAMISGTAGDIGRALARVAAEGATEQEMADAVNAVLATGKAAGLWTQDELHAAFTGGKLDQYGIALIQTVEWENLEDAKVCPICDGYMKKNPWTLSDVPDCPAHVSCRCDIVPGRIIPAAQYRPFLPRR